MSSSHNDRQKAKTEQEAENLGIGGPVGVTNPSISLSLKAHVTVGNEVLDGLEVENSFVIYSETVKSHTFNKGKKPGHWS